MILSNVLKTNLRVAYNVSDLEVVVIIEDGRTLVPGIHRVGICSWIIGRLPSRMTIVIGTLRVNMTQCVSSTQEH